MRVRVNDCLSSEFFLIGPVTIGDGVALDDAHLGQVMGVELEILEILR